MRLLVLRMWNFAQQLSFLSSSALWKHKFLMCPKILSLLPFEDAFKRASSASIIPLQGYCAPLWSTCVRRPSCTCMFVCLVPVKINFLYLCLVVCVVSVKITVTMWKRARTASVRCVSVRQREGQSLALSSTATFVHSFVNLLIEKEEKKKYLIAHVHISQHRSL